MQKFTPCPCSKCSKAADAKQRENQNSQGTSLSRICEPPAPKRSQLPPCCYCPPQEEKPSTNDVKRKEIQQFVCELEKKQMENLVKDRNYPGVIQDTIAGCENFNALAFDIVFGECDLPECEPIVDPISLIEALDKRIDYERCEVNQQELPYRDSIRGSASATTSRIEESFRCKYKTELNCALQSYLKAEEMYLAENPTTNLPSFHADIQKTEVMIPGKPIRVEAFTGSTTPKDC